VLLPSPPVNYTTAIVQTAEADTTPPVITITTPADGAIYLLNQAVLDFA
jgi:hypothetical protein